jgi:hypothetical protein
MSRFRVPQALKRRNEPRKFTPELILRLGRFRDNGQDFSEKTPFSSISKIACRECVRSHNLILFVENFDAASVHPTVPFGVADCRGLTLVPEQAVREAFTLKIPSVMRLARSDFVLIHLQCGVSLADKTLQYQEGFPLASVVQS